MRIGVVSDTHGYFDPRLPEVLAGVETILHAGDVDSPDILEELGQIAPVHAVRGNVDGNELSLPLTRRLHFKKVQIEMQHILSAQPSELEAWSDQACQGKSIPKRRADFLKNFDPATRVVIFGHSHQPCLIAISQKLFFNPGSAGKRRFSLPRCCGLLKISANEIEGWIVSLETEDRDLPGKVRLSITA
ncbi:MAG TPA: metallophosphoesterase family protein [Terriglobia bacterium]|nr:metallophosphoesterase family protein [Terriglobia bacterium]